MDADYHKIYKDNGLGVVAAATSRMIVSYAFPNNLFVAASSRCNIKSSTNPDWVAGKEHKLDGNKLKPLVLGDDKYCWDHEEAS